MGRKNRMIIIAAVCISVFMMLSFAAVTGVQKHVGKNASIRRLLHGVNAASNYMNEKSIGYAYWKDPLSYVSGYELAAFEVDAEEWISPVGWRHETITAAELGDVTGFAVPERRFIDMEIDLPAVYDEWYFVETGRNGPFDEWQYHIGLYSYDGILLIYRGHDLQTDIWMLI